MKRLITDWTVAVKDKVCVTYDDHNVSICNSISDNLEDNEIMVRMKTKFKSVTGCFKNTAHVCFFLNYIWHKSLCIANLHFKNWRQLGRIHFVVKKQKKTTIKTVFV